MDTRPLRHCMMGANRCSSQHKSMKGGPSIAHETRFTLRYSVVYYSTSGVLLHPSFPSRSQLLLPHSRPPFMETDSSPTMGSFVWERPPLGRRAVFQNPLSSGVEITTGKGAKERGSSFLLGFPFRDRGGVTDIDGERRLRSGCTVPKNVSDFRFPCIVSPPVDPRGFIWVSR